MFFSSDCKLQEVRNVYLIHHGIAGIGSGSVSALVSVCSRSSVERMYVLSTARSTSGQGQTPVYSSKVQLNMHSSALPCPLASLVLPLDPMHSVTAVPTLLCDSFYLSFFPWPDRELPEGKVFF